MVDLRTVPGVELLKVGTWFPFNSVGEAFGEWTITANDLASAVEAHRLGAVRRKPVIKLGHFDIRFDGGPALGYVDNLRLADGGSTLLGDFIDVPAPLAKLLRYAYPDRSAEAELNYVDDNGTTWPLIVTAVALLGAEEPAITTLTSLRDIEDLYGVAARRVSLSAKHFQTNPKRHAQAVAVAAARRRRNHRNKIGD